MRVVPGADFSNIPFEIVHDGLERGVLEEFKQLDNPLRGFEERESVNSICGDGDIGEGPDGFEERSHDYRLLIRILFGRWVSRSSRRGRSTELFIMDRPALDYQWLCVTVISFTCNLLHIQSILCSLDSIQPLCYMTATEYQGGLENGSGTLSLRIPHVVHTSQFILQDDAEAFGGLPMILVVTISLKASYLD